MTLWFAEGNTLVSIWSTMRRPMRYQGAAASPADSIVIIPLPSFQVGLVLVPHEMYQPFSLYKIFLRLLCGSLWLLEPWEIFLVPSNTKLISSWKTLIRTRVCLFREVLIPGSFMEDVYGRTGFPCACSKAAGPGWSLQFSGFDRNRLGELFSTFKIFILPL